MTDCQNMYRLQSVTKIIASTFVVFLFLEVTLRLEAFFWFGYSKYYLFYGFLGCSEGLE
jgi:hypothetical protein